MKNTIILFLVQLNARSLTKIELLRVFCLMIFDKFMVKIYFLVLRTPRPNFQDCSEWLLPEVKVDNYVRLKPTQRTQVCTPIQTDLPEPFHFI